MLLDELQKNIEAERKFDEKREKMKYQSKTAKTKDCFDLKKTRFPEIIIETGADSCNSSPEIERPMKL